MNQTQLARLVRERLAGMAGAHLLEGSVDRIVEQLCLHLVDEIDSALEEAIRHAAAFRPGHAICHRCRSAPCAHSEAPSHRHVFVGMSSTGVPRWEDFAQHCLDLRHPDVDRLFDAPPALVTLIRTRADLAAGLIDSVREATPALRGQVAAGFFSIPKRAGEGRGVLALTFQIAVSRRDGRSSRWALNVLGCTPAREPLELLWERQDLVPWRGAVRWAQAALSSLDRVPRSDDPAIDRRVEGILAGLARRLSHERRSAGRRTRHAEERHRTGERPTRNAMEDARQLVPSDVMVDERNGTLVVAGARGRIHFYTPAGRLVSSVRYSRDAIEKKRKLGLWRPSRPDESEQLRRALAPQP